MSGYKRYVMEVRHRVFLSEITVDENGTIRPKHERLLKAENSLVKLINKDVYLLT